MKPKRNAEREIKTMTEMMVNKAWYEEVLATGKVEMFDMEEIEEHGTNRKYIIFNANREEFDKVSEELGWI